MPTVSKNRILVLGCWFLLTAQAAPQPYDLIISGGRVLDPETGMDKVANVALRAGRIAEISEAPLIGKRVLNAKGLVVAPGFIDLHAHGQHLPAQRLQALDGVTTAIEAELGAMPMAPYYAALSGNSLINFGATASHQCARIQALAKLACAGHGAANDQAREVEKEVLSAHREALTQGAAPIEARQIVDLLERSLADGALGYGLGIEYTPGAARSEIYDIFKSAAKLDVPVFVHVRRRTPDGAAGAAIAAAQEVIADASATGASLQIMHVHSTGLGDTPVILDMIGNAVRHGVNIATEAYPYTAGSTAIGSEFFADGWQQRAGISYSDLQWPKTGERLTEESFNRLRKEQPTAAVIVHMIPADVVDAAITNPLVMIASDGMAWHTSGEHPRGAGTFSRVLGRYVRERGLLTLPDAIAKMTIMPAKRLEGIAPVMRRKGRIQTGMDADITIFDPDTVIDRATFTNPMQPARGIKYVLVGGTLIVKDEQIVTDALPGKPIKSRYAN